jgi:hypothetical protein
MQSWALLQIAPSDVNCRMKGTTSKWTFTSQIHFLIGVGMPSLARTPVHQHSTNAAG